jgi:hypothetical protein
MEESKTIESVNGSSHSHESSERPGQSDFQDVHINGAAPNAAAHIDGSHIDRKPVGLPTEPTLASFSHLDHGRILRKMDVRLIPMLAVLYLLAFLDRKLLTDPFRL